MTGLSVYRLQHLLFAGFTIGVAALAIAACSGPNSTSSSANALPQADRTLVAARPLAADPSPTPYQFLYVTVDDPGSGTFNQLLGLDDLAQVVGYYGTGQSHGFTSLIPYLTFKALQYPGSVSTVITSMNSGGRMFGGYFVDDTGTTWGLIRNHGLWSQYKDPKTPKGAGSVNELLGINDSSIAVGFYTAGNGNDAAYEFANNGYHALNPPGAVSAMATGINLRGDIVGNETLSNKTTEGWILRNGTYTQFSYPHSVSTQACALNYQEQVVGSYVGSDGNTHGFILTKPDSIGQQYWQQVDAPDAVGTTVITGINNHHTITGWYVDSSGNTDGFVATLK